MFRKSSFQTCTFKALPQPHNTKQTFFWQHPTSLNLMTSPLKNHLIKCAVNDKLLNGARIVNPPPPPYIGRGTVIALTSGGQATWSELKSSLLKIDIPSQDVSDFAILSVSQDLYTNTTLINEIRFRYTNNNGLTRWNDINYVK